MADDDDEGCLQGVNPSWLAEDLDYPSRHYHFLSFSKLLDCYERLQSIRPNLVVITSGRHPAKSDIGLRTGQGNTKTEESNSEHIRFHLFGWLCFLQKKPDGRWKPLFRTFNIVEELHAPLVFPAGSYTPDLVKLAISGGISVCVPNSGHVCVVKTRRLCFARD